MGVDRLWQIVRLRLRSLLSGDAVDRELDDELGYHLEQQIDANLGRGMTPEAARTAALLAIGGVEQRKEECRDARGISTSSCGARTGSARRLSAFSSWKIAVLAPMPSASDTIAVTANPGWRRS